MASQEFRVSDVCETADKLTNDQHPESQVVTNKKGRAAGSLSKIKVSGH